MAPVDNELRSQWRNMLTKRRFEPALALDDRGQQLRQDSPLSRVSPQADRLAIIRACKGRNSNT